jgi:hypothetical protein
VGVVLGKDNNFEAEMILLFAMSVIGFFLLVWVSIDDKTKRGS